MHRKSNRAGRPSGVLKGIAIAIVAGIRMALDMDTVHSFTPRMPPQRLFMDNPINKHLPCGAALFGGHFRVGCVLKCCIVPEVHGDTDSGWDTDDQSLGTWSYTNDSEPTSPRALVELSETESEGEVVVD